MQKNLSREERQAAREAWRAANGIVTEEAKRQEEKLSRGRRPPFHYPKLVGNGWQIIDGWRLPGSRL